MSSTIFIIYNAKASITGKLMYGYRKLTNKSCTPTCAACDLTHGGLNLDESAEWKATKQKIPAEVRQLHQDELTSDLKSFIDSRSLKYPIVLGQQPPNALALLMNSEEIATVSNNHNDFLKRLETKAKENGLPWAETQPQKL